MTAITPDRRETMAQALKSGESSGLPERAYRAGKIGAEWDSWLVSQNLQGISPDQKRELANEYQRGKSERRSTGGGGGW